MNRILLSHVGWCPQLLLGIIRQTKNECAGLLVGSSLAGPLELLVPLPISQGRSTRSSDRLHDFSVTIPRCYKDAYVNSFFLRRARLWNSLPIECFPLTYNLNSFKYRIGMHLLAVGSL